MNSSVGRGMGVEGRSAMVAGREVLEPGSWCVSGTSMNPQSSTMSGGTEGRLDVYSVVSCNPNAESRVSGFHAEATDRIWVSGVPP